MRNPLHGMKILLGMPPGDVQPDTAVPIALTIVDGGHTQEFVRNQREAGEIRLNT